MAGTVVPRDQRLAVPVPGQLVTVRHRQWVVADVSRGEVASSDPHVLTGRAPHPSPECSAPGASVRVPYSGG
ncbi:MAG: hypothetical protein JO063_09325 [Pseudonocardiales bacterium]|nr:hypothetical protein [Pseudonocardiales bacterium]MBV9030643.1 hypothetical protein [Pseudonocardiales bacterium]MBW0010300.1 hypothetical protein [Pseudonocardiales bacterium]